PRVPSMAIFKPLFPFHGSPGFTMDPWRRFASSHHKDTKTRRFTQEHGGSSCLCGEDRIVRSRKELTRDQKRHERLAFVSDAPKPENELQAAAGGIEPRWLSRVE